ncbi:hypothetical protein [Salinarimonas sp.]|uniref:hypothetical protein n=1 Tax=Salinarimonas sp. TaxID=2766526 RepID=UPI0032D8F183
MSDAAEPDRRREARRELVTQALAADGDCCAADATLLAAEGCCRCRADRPGEPPAAPIVESTPPTPARRLPAS